MAHGPGKYDAVCEFAREVARAEGCILIVIRGCDGNGFSCNAPMDVQVMLPDILEDMAKQIREELARLN